MRYKMKRNKAPALQKCPPVYPLAARDPASRRDVAPFRGSLDGVHLNG